MTMCAIDSASVSTLMPSGAATVVFQPSTSFFSAVREL
jgi:hypothetical protein